MQKLVDSVVAYIVVNQSRNTQHLGRVSYFFYQIRSLFSFGISCMKLKIYPRIVLCFRFECYIKSHAITNNVAVRNKVLL